MGWMVQMLDQDDRERIEENRTFIEYLAAFINPKAVQDLKNMAKDVKQTDSDNFAKTLERLSGEPLDPELTKILDQG